MNSSQYVVATTFTRHGEDEIFDMSLRAKFMADKLHLAIGIVTEAGEVADIYKKAMAYGKVVDETHLREELGDVLWYMAHLAHRYGWTLEDLMEVNVRKLCARYGDKFTSHAALNRDLEAEGAALSTLVPDINT
jgi:NTP pyrophosphatase (non-canonical NTP hydrolase)